MCNNIEMGMLILKEISNRIDGAYTHKVSISFTICFILFYFVLFVLDC